ncbi:MAG: hypothetical protein EBU52_13765, partial [Cytophagia bacterium]|nr:hypothetical protein [Cytophagia bacterium]
TIKGNNFGTSFEDLLVFVNGFSDVDSLTTISWAMAKIVERGNDFAKIIIPTTEGYYYKFRVTADYATTVSDVNFFIEEPQITSISPKINLIPGQLVKIEGDRLNPGDYPFDHRSSVILGGAKSYAKSASSSLINYVVPFAKTNVSFLKMSFFGKEVSSALEVSTPFRTISTMPGESRSLATGFSIGKNAFVLTGYAGPTELNNEVWMLNSQNYTWKRRHDFPGGKRHHATSFSLNGMGYLLGGNGPDGQTILSSRPYNDLWEYNPLNDSWIRKKDIPFHAVSAIQVGNEIYATADQTFYFEPGTGRIWGHGGGKSLWKYIPTSDEWLRLPDYGGDFFFTTKNDLYTIINRASLYEIFRYDVNSASWISVSFIQINLNGQRAYFVLNETTSLILADKKFYKFSSLTNQLTLLTTIDERIWTGDMSARFEIEGRTFFSLFGNGPIQDLNNIPNLHNSLIEFSPNLFNIN